MSDWLVIGHVAKAHGVRGGLKLHVDNPASETLRVGLVVRVGEAERVIERVLGDHRVHLEGVSDRDAADALRGSEVAVARADLPPIDDDEVYLIDLIGLPVVDKAGEPLGTVASFSDNVAQILVHVKTEAAEVVVPFIKPILVEVAEDRIILDPPMGFFDAEADEAE